MLRLDRRALMAGLPLLAAAPAAFAAPTGARPGLFLLGADISWIPQDEADGAVFYAGGQRRDILAILGDAGFNAVKLRVFVDPANGYSKSRPVDPWCGKDQTVAMAKRVKAAGMHLTISFHYSDNWADPQKQVKPAAWKDLPFDGLVKAVGDHTRDVLAALNKAGAPADMVVIGNEITFGLLWPDGRVPLPMKTGNPNTDAVHLNVPDAGGFDKLAALLSAGLDASRQTAPKARTSLHNHLGPATGRSSSTGPTACSRAACASTPWASPATSRRPRAIGKGPSRASPSATRTTASTRPNIPAGSAM